MTDRGGDLMGAVHRSSGGIETFEGRWDEASKWHSSIKIS